MSKWPCALAPARPRRSTAPDKRAMSPFCGKADCARRSPATRGGYLTDEGGHAWNVPVRSTVRAFPPPNLLESSRVRGGACTARTCRARGAAHAKGNATVATATATATGVDHGPALQRALTSRSTRASGDAMTTRAQRRAASTGGRAATSRAHAAQAARRDGGSDRGVSRAGLQAGRPRRCPRIATRTSRRSL